MQTISIPFDCSDEERTMLREWRRAYGAAVRTAHEAAAAPGPDGFVFVEEKTVREHVKHRYEHLKAIDAWLLHCATRDGIALRKRVPDGTTVFGGKDNLLRRQKGLISIEEWRSLRLRPLCSLGDRSFKGNRHFRLSDDGRTCSVRVYGKTVQLHLPELRGKWGELLPMAAKLASLGEMNVTFRLGKTLDVTFDEMNLRRLPRGVTLQQVKDDALGEHKSRGRPRGKNYVPPKDKWAEHPRPVHPEWRTAVRRIASRALGIDLNPNWVGLTVIESEGSLGATRILDYRLVRFDLPENASNEVVREALSAVVTHALSMARGWNVSVIGLEDGLGHLRSGGRNKANNRLINGWARNAVHSILERRCALADMPVCKVWAGYSTVIGNTAFDIPDSCAAAGEIARRTLCVRSGLDVLPEYEPGLVHRRWKDDALVEAEIRAAGTWRDYQQGINAAKARDRSRTIGVRRPHPALAGVRPRSGSVTVADHVVTRLGLRHRPGLIARPSARAWTVEQPERRGIESGDSTLKSG